MQLGNNRRLYMGIPKFFINTKYGQVFLKGEINKRHRKVAWWQTKIELSITVLNVNELNISTKTHAWPFWGVGEQEQTN